MANLPASLADLSIELEGGGRRLVYRFDDDRGQAGPHELLKRLDGLGVGWTDIETSASSLEDIFVDLVGRAA
jgi:ABC-2 type transport system ATP-binding protein